MQKGVPELIWYFFDDAAQKKKDLIDRHFLHWEHRAWFSFLAFFRHTPIHTHTRPPSFLPSDVDVAFRFHPRFFQSFFVQNAKKKGRKGENKKRWWFFGFVFVTCRVHMGICTVLFGWSNRPIYLFLLLLHALCTYLGGRSREKKRRRCPPPIPLPSSSPNLVAQPRHPLWFVFYWLPPPVLSTLHCFFSIIRSICLYFSEGPKGSVRVQLVV